MRLAFALFRGLFRATLSLICLFSCWGTVYRFPAGTPQFLDLRNSNKEKPYCVSFCAALADNPLGFPGHAYLLFSESTRVNPASDYSLGFMPEKYEDQIPSLITQVNGALLENVRGNDRNLERLTVILPESKYRSLINDCRKWHKSSFQCGKRDCADFVAFAAQSLGLEIPSSYYVYPQDFLKRLKGIKQKLPISPHY